LLERDFFSLFPSRTSKVGSDVDVVGQKSGVHSSDAHDADGDQGYGTHPIATHVRDGDQAHSWHHRRCINNERSTIFLSHENCNFYSESKLKEKIHSWRCLYSYQVQLPPF
jgi:hypothetical protein